MSTTIGMTKPVYIKNTVNIKSTANTKSTANIKSTVNTKIADVSTSNISTVISVQRVDAN